MSETSHGSTSSRSSAFSHGRPRSLYLFDGVRDLWPPRSHRHRPGPTGSIGQETRQALRSGGRSKLSCEGIIEPVIFGSLRSLRPLKKDLRTSGHGAASWYGTSSSRRRQIEHRYVRVLELQPHRSPRHRPVRRGTTNKVVGVYEEEFPTWEGAVTNIGYRKPAPLPSMHRGGRRDRRQLSWV